jgi:hypothetical protein
MSEEELVADLEANRDRDGEWSEEPTAVEVRAKGTDVVSFRLPAEEFEALLEAKSQAGESMSEYIRKALAIRMYGQPIGPAVEVTSGAHRLVVRSVIVTSSRTEGAPIVSDFPPSLVSHL